MTATIESFQISPEAAEFYESRFVPRLFSPWARYLVETAEVAPGMSILDVACGTGAVAREALVRLGGKGRVVGVDVNLSMLAVARRLAPEIEWQEADAMRLPFEAECFDAVLCQAALMFFPDRVQALREMARVVRPSGTVAVQVWGSLESQPAYSRFVDVAARHAGPEAIKLLGAYWSLGDTVLLRKLFADAGLHVSNIDTRLAPATFDSIDELVRIEVESTPLGARISSEVYERILEDSRKALASFRTPNGQAEIPLQGHVVTARRR